MTLTNESRIRETRHHLLALHKHLLDVEREQHERVAGRVAPANFLRLLIEDPAFAWLRPMTELIVQIDEWLDDDERVDEAGAGWLTAIEQLLVADDGGTPFQRRYAQLLQERPELVLAHGAVMRALRTK